MSSLPGNLTEPSAQDVAIRRLMRLAVDLGGATFGGPLSTAEHDAVHSASSEPPSPASEVASAETAIRQGQDPLGQALADIRAVSHRRRLGAFYTPPVIVDTMVRWVLAQKPSRTVDAGCGTGRFAAAVSRRRPALDVVAVDVDPVATLLCRAHLRVAGAWRASVVQTDYTHQFTLPVIPGRTAFVGNPPYVRHHELPAEVKGWGSAMAARLGVPFSQLAGLHVHFFLATALAARPGDVGCFITASEWLDVRYGACVRSLLLGALGAESLHLLAPDSVPFDDAMTTAVIACFRAGAVPPTVRMRLAAGPDSLRSLGQGGHRVRREEAIRASRWTPLIHRRHVEPATSDLVPLGEFASVHRGIVTGDNGFFVLDPETAAARGLSAYALPVVASAKEVLALGEPVIRDTHSRTVLVSLPRDLPLKSATKAVRAFVAEGEQRGVPERYICAHRRPWWSVGEVPRPPIIATYMARQAPGFALNPDGLGILNVLHGIYPRAPLSTGAITALVAFLNAHRPSLRGHGRTYHGGLEKFEPREMEALSVPRPAVLEQMAQEVVQ